MSWFRAKPSRITVADRARDAGQWRVATAYYRSALLRNRQNPPIWVQYGHVLKGAGHLQEAEAAYREAIAHNPLSADPHLQLGSVLKLQGKRKAAEAAYLACTGSQSIAQERVLCPFSELDEIIRMALPACSQSRQEPIVRSWDAPPSIRLL
jgi:tetratricopeptide (TPR) repeat protein